MGVPDGKECLLSVKIARLIDVLITQLYLGLRVVKQKKKTRENETEAASGGGGQPCQT